eukprot:TRINITY_DN14929_c0_g1_i1.p1 TRINITY_DN14929_c0_g1~~TRINITY_DN14929_c0_g1_i1.p1  ORF type:complete len:169 (-),score=31.77 TRINITY_DN14929_c0_g1_i1:77-583(-)
MAILSRLVGAGRVLSGQVRQGSAAVVKNRPSRWDWDLFKDYLHFYVLLGVIPLGAIVVYANVFKGKAVLKPLPEDYVPQDYEYHRHPITRWMVRNFYPSLQQKYENHLSMIWEEAKITNMRALQREVHRQMKVHADYKGWYTQDVSAEQLRRVIQCNKGDVESQGFRV